MDFNQFLTLFQPDEEFRSRLGAAQRLWEQSAPDKQQAIIAWLKQHGRYKGRNPYFFIQDFKPQSAGPTNMNGRALSQGVQYVTAKYNGKWGTYSMEDVEKFGLEIGIETRG